MTKPKILLDIENITSQLVDSVQQINKIDKLNLNIFNKIPIKKLVATATSANAGTYTGSKAIDGIEVFRDTSSNPSGWVTTVGNGIGEHITVSTTNKKIIAIGDSMTAGHPYHDPNSTTYGATDDIRSCYEWHLQKMLSGYKIINKGIGGQRTDQILARFTTDLIDEKPSYCIILAGINDLFQSVSVATIKSNLQQMYELCINNSIKPILCTLIPNNHPSMAQYGYYSTEIQNINAWIKQYAKDNNLDVADFWTAFVDLSTNNVNAYSSYIEDGTHPSILGYSVMASCINPKFFLNKQNIKAIALSFKGNSVFSSYAKPVKVYISHGETKEEYSIFKDVEVLELVENNDESFEIGFEAFSDIRAITYADIKKIGTWVAFSSGNYSTDTDAEQKIFFNGTTAIVKYRTSTDGGDFTIKVDGEVVSIINAYSDTVVDNNVYNVSTVAGNHLLEVVKTSGAKLMINSIEGNTADIASNKYTGIAEVILYS